MSNHASTMAAALGALALAGALSVPASGQPPEFPNVDALPAVDLTAYEVNGAHPGGSGWVFVTPNGLRCSISLIADLGVQCVGTVAGTRDSIGATASLTTPGRIQPADVSGRDSVPLLATGSKIVAAGVVCAVLADDLFACRAGRPDTWNADTRYSEHGFVVQGSRHSTY